MKNPANSALKRPKNLKNIGIFAVCEAVLNIKKVKNVTNPADIQRCGGESDTKTSKTQGNHRFFQHPAGARWIHIA